MTTQTTGKFLLKIQSTSDLITNSSSEVFICQLDDISVKEFKELVTQYHKAHQFLDTWRSALNLSDETYKQYDFCSGDGGALEFITYKEAIDDWDEDAFTGLENPDNYILIRSDHAHYATNKWLVETLNAKELD